MSYLTGCNIAGTNTWNLLANAPTTNWSGITCSSDGKTVYACAGNASTSGYIYTSTNYGTNWTTITGASNNWSSIECNSNGIFGAAIASGTNQIYTTTNWGTTWTPYASSLNWSGITVNGTGQYMNACVNGGLIYRSTTFGNIWASTTTGNRAWSGIASDITGQNIVACVNGGNIWISTNYGISGSFSTTGPSSLQSWSCIAINTTGQYIAAGTSTVGGNIWVSPTGGFGNIWFSNFSSPYSSWKNISVSSTGMYMAAIEQTGNIYLSTNYGQSWLQQTSYTNTWKALCMNYSGQYMYAGSDTNIYAFSQTMSFEQIFKTIQSPGGPDTGFNIGGTPPNIYTTQSPSVIWQSIDCNSTGNFIIGSTASAGSIGIWISNDYGNTWNNTYTTAASNVRCSSSTGQYCISTNSYLLVSSNFGNTWNVNDSLSSLVPGIAISGINISAYGNIIACLNVPGTTADLYVSTNYGSTWVKSIGKGTGNLYNSMNMNSTGQYIIISETYTTTIEYLYISSNYGVSFFTISSSIFAGAAYGGCVNSTGQYMAVGQLNTMFISSNYGSTWNTISLTTSSLPRTIVMSSTGQYMAYGCNGFILLSSNYGNSWNTVVSSGNYDFHTVVMGNSGMFFILAKNTSTQIQIYIKKSDFANSFESINTATNILVPASTPGFNYTLQKQTLINPGRLISSICTSASGQYILLGLSYYSYNAAVSNNYGQTFTDITNIVGTNSAVNIRVHMSSSGQYMYVVNGVGSERGLYRSTNYGVSFSTVPTGSFTVSTSCINTSSTGQYTIVSFYSGSTFNFTIFISTNYGATFLQNSLPPSSNFVDVCVNYSGQYYGISTSGGVYISSNSGTSFTYVPIGFNPSSVSCNNTGQYFVVAASDSRKIYISNNYGKSFYLSSSPSILWANVRISSSGQTIVGISMTSGNNNIYISKNYGLTWNNIPISVNLPSDQFKFSTDNNITTLVYVESTIGNIYMINLSQELGSLFQSI